jgi:hypothetical protein
MQLEIAQLFAIIGEAVVYFGIFLLVIAGLGSLLIFYSFKTEKFPEGDNVPKGTLISIIKQ